MKYQDILGELCNEQQIEVLPFYCNFRLFLLLFDLLILLTQVYVIITSVCTWSQIGKGFCFQFQVLVLLELRVQLSVLKDLQRFRASFEVLELKREPMSPIAFSYRSLIQFPGTLSLHKDVIQLDKYGTMSQSYNLASLIYFSTFHSQFSITVSCL